MLTLVTVRVDNESAKVKGELAAARRATDEAIRKVYDILNALAVLQPSAELTALTTVLFGIEDRAKLYYISGGKSGGDRPTPTPDGGGSDDGGSSDGGSDVTPVTPEPTPTPTPDPSPTPTPDPSGGGDDSGGSGGGDE